MLIRERMESYADATFRRDAEAWLANWTDDAVWTLPIGRSTGKAELHAQWNKGLGYPETNGLLHPARCHRG